MEKTLVATGKTIDLAIEAALEQLGLDRDSVSVQVLQQAKSGFLGFGAQPAKVEVTYEVADPVPAAPKSALSSASRSKPKVNSLKQPEAPKPQPKKAEAPKAPRPEAPKAPRPEATKAPKAEKPAAPKAERPAPPKVEVPKTFVPAEPGSVEAQIEEFLKGLLEHMGSDAVPHAWKVDETTYQVELTGENLGFLIGRQGDTLDALQHLTNYSVGRKIPGHVRINVDAENYRQKREDSLTRYARKKAQQVLKNRRRITLEPMNAYERHVVHAALQDVENINTHSTGNEPNRRVVIEYIR